MAGRRKVKKTGSRERRPVVVTAKVNLKQGVAAIASRTLDPRRGQDSVEPGETFVVRFGDKVRWRLLGARGGKLALGRFEPRVRFKGFPKGVRRRLFDSRIEQDEEGQTYRVNGVTHTVSRNSVSGRYRYHLVLFDKKTRKTKELTCSWTAPGRKDGQEIGMFSNDKDPRP